MTGMRKASDIMMVWRLISNQNITSIEELKAVLGRSQHAARSLLSQLRLHSIVEYEEGAIRLLVPYGQANTGMCPWCKIPYALHMRCAGCGVYVGGQHAEQERDLVDGRCLCCHGIVITRHLDDAERDDLADRMKRRRAA